MFLTDIDRHSTYIKKMQKSPKDWENVGRCTSYTYFTHARKKVIFFYIERYGNDLHRPTSFLFHRLEERSFSHTKQKHLQLLLYVNQHLAQAFSFIFVGFAPPFQKRPSPTVTKKCKKARKLGRKDGSAEKGTRKKFRFWERFVFDRHRPTFDLHQKDAKKPEKLGECRCMNLIFLPYAREKKSKNFFYIERYGNDQHRPTLSFFHRMAGRKVLHENRNLFVA